ncbi:protein neprosin [Silene latifolia]|uniref:protein neprosin n=1 Tax=Silene latifolia TaxID=37657 RepID=UPI003D77656D
MGIVVCKKKNIVSYCFSSFHSVLVLLLLVSLFLEGFTVVCGLNYTKYRNRKVSKLRLDRIQNHVDQINKPHVFSIQSPDGDIINCVHKRKQPAFDHPLLKNHKIQKEPPEMPKGLKMKINEEKDGSSKNNKDGSKEIDWQMWHLNGTRCPKGTVPIRRSTVQDVLRAKSLYDYGRKSPRSFPLTNRNDAPDGVNGNGHEHAIAYTGSPEEIYGAKATINVWDPSIEEINEFSLSQIWVLSGDFGGPDLNSIEAGWQVSPELYGDTRPRLFTYWTSDSYQATGCYNLLCAGFIQTHSRIAIGAAISPVSSFSSNQFDITILIWKDPQFGNWWMNFGGNINVGYWPAELFSNLASHATLVEWGGEVVNTRANGLHTSTQMGSGHFAEDGFGKASYFRNLEIVDSDNSLSPAHDLLFLAEDPNCYDVQSSYDNDWGQHFYYGGPGRNPKCQ